MTRATKAKCAVVYIDDSEDDHFLFRMAVSRTRTPFILRTFTSHEPALAYLAGHAPYHDRDIHPFPEVLLCDYDLGPRKGTEVVAMVRELEHCADLPIVILSGRTGRAVLTECYSAGAICFLCKPFAVHRWNAVVKALYQCATCSPQSWAGLETLEECLRLPENLPRKPPLPPRGSA